MEPEGEPVHNTAMMVVGNYTGSFSLDQVCAIFDYLKSGNGSIDGWRYYPDPRGVDLYYYANMTLINGQNMKASGAGDCDDFALAYNEMVGQAYAEVYLGSINETGNQVEYVVEALKERYKIETVFTHVNNVTGDVWLNLDWGQDEVGLYHPGGPFFSGTKHVPLLIRDQYGKTPMRAPLSADGTRPLTYEEIIAMATLAAQHNADGVPVINIIW